MRSLYQSTCEDEHEWVVVGHFTDREERYDEDSHEGETFTVDTLYETEECRMCGAVNFNGIQETIVIWE